MINENPFPAGNTAEAREHAAKTLVAEHVRAEIAEHLRNGGEDQIRQMAYAIWEQRGGGDGQALDDWLAAEAQHKDA